MPHVNAPHPCVQVMSQEAPHTIQAPPEPLSVDETSTHEVEQLSEHDESSREEPLHEA